MYQVYTTWPQDEEFLRIWFESPFYDGHPENTEDKRFTLFQLVKAVSRLDGDTAECGVGRGVSSYLILKANVDAGKVHHVFDSFEGLSTPGPQDKVSAKKVFRWKKHDLRHMEAEVMDNLRGFHNVRLYKGWIPSHFDDVCGQRFSFVHIDVDLYQPTYDSLCFFYPLVSPGGIILFDDYGYESCPGVRAACDDFMHDNEEEIVQLPTGQAFIIKSCRLVNNPP